MSTARRPTLLLLGTTVAYLLIGIEIVVMISPFALYFYSVYGPILKFFAAHPGLAWTTEFFLPHMVFSDDPLVVGISYLQLLFIVGLLLFFSAAVPLYYGRFTKQGVVQMSFYRKIRHPQYLFLAISGFGLLLYWPRFIILIMYVTMLFVYYLLARNEEWRMSREAPESYERYMAETPMFLPGEPGGRIFRLLFGWLPSKTLGLVAAYVVTMALAVLVAMAIRAHTVRTLPAVSFARFTMLPVFPQPKPKLAKLYRTLTTSPRVAAQLDRLAPNLAYIFPGDFFLTAIVTDQDRRYFPEDMVQHIPEAFEWHAYKFRGGLGKFFKIFHNYFKTLGTMETDYYVERVVFVRIGAEQATPPTGRALFGLGRQRRPVLIVDLDTESGAIVSVLPTTGANKWGTTPMPVF